MTSNAAQPQLRKPQSVRGARLRFRDATVADAEFILSLRTDERKNAFLSKTSADLQAQRAWLEGYARDSSQIYFIIEDSDGTPVGTVRMYDVQGSSFCWGSWILSDAAPKSSAIESTLMIYSLGLALGFDSSHFDVRKGNEKVWQYHERLGAVRTAETDLDYYYRFDKTAMEAFLGKYASRLPDGVEIVL